MIECLAERPWDKATRWSHISLVPQCSLYEGHDGPHKDELMQEAWDA